jgi:hypothetical protein
MDEKFKAIAYFFALAFSRMKRVQIMLANLTFKLIPFRHLYRATMYPGSQSRDIQRHTET